MTEYLHDFQSESKLLGQMSVSAYQKDSDRSGDSIVTEGTNYVTESLTGNIIVQGIILVHSHMFFWCDFHSFFRRFSIASTMKLPIKPWEQC